MSHNPPNRLWAMERLAHVSIAHNGVEPAIVQSFFCDRPDYRVAIVTHPIVLGAGGHFDPTLISPDDVAYELSGVKFIVTNTAGTQVIGIAVTADLEVAETDTTTVLPYAGTAAAFTAVGADLALVNNSGAMRITSTAGGVFVATLEFSCAAVE